MKELFKYQGYYGSAEISKEDRCLFGKILFINDLVLYHADTYDELEKEFQSAVSDYINTCKMVEKEPEKPFKGSFNVRISPDLHRNAALGSHKQGISLNEYVSKAIQAYSSGPDSHINVEHHNHVHHHYGKHDSIFEQTMHIPDASGESPWKISSSIMSKQH